MTGGLATANEERRPLTREDPSPANTKFAGIQDDSLQEENKRLRAELESMQVQLARLRKRSHRSTRSPSKRTKNATRKGPAHKKKPRHRRSLSADSGMQNSELELPMLDLEGRSVEIRGMLHHRHPLAQQQQPVSDRPWRKRSPDRIKAKLSDVEQGNSSSDEESLLTTSLDDSVDFMDRQPQQVQHSFWKDVADRAGWLVGLMILQSCSSFILRNHEHLLQEHPVIVQFLTMLVGAGGNSGNQAAVRVIRGLATGTITNQNVKAFLKTEMIAGVCLSLILGLVGCIRAAVFLTPLPETLAITLSLLCIVIISIIIGATLPLGMRFVGIDPAHSSTTIQVVMDILGVSLTVWIGAGILNSALGLWLARGRD